MKLSGIQIIIAEDDEGLLEIMEINLQKLGAQVQAAKDGNEAFVLWSKSPSCQIVISDVNMPGAGADGFTLARRIREANQTFPIILLSGHAEGSMDKASSAGASAFMTKPFSWEELPLLVLELVPRD